MRALSIAGYGIFLTFCGVAIVMAIFFTAAVFGLSLDDGVGLKEIIFIAVLAAGAIKTDSLAKSLLPPDVYPIAIVIGILMSLYLMMVAGYFLHILR